MEEIIALLTKLGLDPEKLQKGELTADAAYTDVVQRTINSAKGKIELEAAAKAAKGAYTKAEKAILARFGLDEKTLDGVTENERIEKLLEEAQSGYQQKLKELEEKAASGDDTSKLSLEITTLRQNLEKAGKDIQSLQVEKKKIAEKLELEKQQFIHDHYVETNLTKTLASIADKLIGGSAQIPALESFLKVRASQLGYTLKAEGKDKLELVDANGLQVYEGTTIVTPAVFAERIANEARMIPQSNGAPGGNGGGSGNTVKFDDAVANSLNPAFAKLAGQ